MEIKQYSIFLVNLNPTKGSEIKKTRPCLVVSPDEMNRHLRTVIVAPMTTREKNYPSRVSIILNNKKGWAALDQIRTIDKSRLVKYLGKAKRNETQNCKNVIREMLVD